MKKLVSAPALFAGAGVLLIVGVVLAFWYSPVDASSMGFSQKILYYHAPIADGRAGGLRRRLRGRRSRTCARRTSSGTASAT